MISLGIKEKRDLSSLWIISFIVFMLIFPVIVNAQTDSITMGIDWLLSSQNSDGSWSEGPRIYEDTYTVLETLLYLKNVSNAQVSQAVSWIGIQDSSTTDDLAHKVLLLSLAGEDTSGDLPALLAFINEDNGWGTDRDFSSDILDTTLALQALNQINHPDMETISYALFYLTSNQNTDGGFGFYPGDDSNVYMTALVLKTLSSYGDTFDLQAEIDDAVQYLLTKQNPDGGFGTDISTVYETALALDALIASNVDISAVAQSAIDYLLTSQQPDGSWEQDPYSTALALRALANIKPNLSITRDDITFSNPTPTVGDTITITATIHNTGIADSENVLVQFYDGDPNSGGILICEAVIPSISMDGSSVAAIIAEIVYNI